MPAGRQLNIRLSATAWDRLARSSGLRAPSASLARDIVLEYPDRHGDEPGLRGALISLAEHNAASRAQAEVSRIDSRQRRS